MASGLLLQYWEGKKHNKKCLLIKWGHEQKHTSNIGSQKELIRAWLFTV